MDQHTPGAKLDHDKVDMSLLVLIADALTEVCRVMDYGQTKYTRGGFAYVLNGQQRYTAAMLRHLMLEQKEVFDSGDPFYDTEEGARFKGKLRHDAQVAVNALFRLQVQINDEIEDQRRLDAIFDQEYNRSDEHLEQKNEGFTEKDC